MIRPHASFFAAGTAVLLGVAGLVVGAVPQSSSSTNSGSTSSIVVTGAYVREPASPVNAAAYFTVTNTGTSADVLTTVSTGAGASSSLHIDGGNGAMQLNAAGLTVPAKSSVTLSPGKGHLMIEQLYDTPKPGQTVNLQLTFAHAGMVLVTAPVIAIAAAAPTTTTVNK